MCACSAVGEIRLPKGFKIETYARVRGARHLTCAPDGTLFVGTANSSVYAVTPRREVRELARGLNSPNGVAFANGDLYIGEIHRLSRIRNVLEHLDGKARLEVLNDQLPKARHHGLRVLRFGPDGRLYIGVGAPCNVGETPLPHATLSRFSSDFRRVEPYCLGVRNTMGFDWSPADATLWFSDNGRDLLGDDIPPEEINQAPKSGMHFGFPYHFGNNQPDPEYGPRLPGGLRTTPPKISMPAHVAPLGLRFYQGSQFPASYQGAIFLANHGSWNRSTPVGYRLVVAYPKTARSEIFAEGWLQGSKVSGRPVDVEVLPDGSLIVSDDHGGNLYRISYSKP